ncbi:MAG: hypothetical protein ACFFBP_14325 [Promethearchaeota archaeon]
METKQSVKLKRAKGIGGVLQKQLAPLETNEKFLERYSNLKLTLLLNAKDSKYAAVVRFNDGNIMVESVSNADEKALSKKVLFWDGMLKTTTPIFLKIAMGELGLGAMAKKMISRKIKAKGIKNLLKLQKIFALL